MSKPAQDLSSREALLKIIQGEGLSRVETKQLFGSLMDGELSEVTKSALLAALAVKGESAEEVAGAVEAMRSRVVLIPTDRHNVVDTCGTGGDGSGTFNISTAAAFVAAAAGVPIAKHGNRSVSSRSGSADVLEALGVELEIEPHDATSALEQIGIAFLFAPKLHPAMREVMQVRRDLGVRTIFNILGPLTNPAGARRQVVGVFEDRLVELVAEVLVKLGCDHALVVRGSDGLDELTTTGETRVSEVRDDDIDNYVVTPESFGFERVDSSVLRGGDPSTNAEIMTRVLSGESSPLSDITVFNAGAAIYVGGLTTSLGGGVAQARRTIGSGAGLQSSKSCATFLQAGKATVGMSDLPDVLNRIVGQRRKRLEAEMDSISTQISQLRSQREQVAPISHSFVEAIGKGDEKAVIAEVKMGSPRLGSLVGRVDPTAIAVQYAANGAAGLSVVVEPDFFSGSYELLSQCQKATGLPTLAKDFVVDPIQIELACASGASALLLIAALYTQEELRTLASQTRDLGLEPLIECHTVADAEKLDGATWELVGVNNRDLRTFEVDLEHSIKLLSSLPASAFKVAESGISTAAQLEDLKRAGFDAFLVGESLLLNDDPGAKLRQLRAVDLA